MEKESTEKSVL